MALLMPLGTRAETVVGEMARAAASLPQKASLPRFLFEPGALWNSRP